MTDAIDPWGVVDGGSTWGGDRPQKDGVNFYRPVVCLLGLPFDAVTVSQAVRQIRRDAFAGRRCFVSTPNLNFIMAARADPAFRSSVLCSNLSLVDGMPLVWVARLLKLPVPERVAGSDVFEALQSHQGPPLSVYLFGGPPGAAAAACEAINRRKGGLRCVGHDDAGFGSLESMSSDERIERINASGAHFVIASLGAKKGQAWLAHNAARLNAPVLSHLGAALNFAAGTLRRAPPWMRWGGLEWIWRVKEEPALWRRYWHDGSTALALLVTRVIPDAVTSAIGRHLRTPKATVSIEPGSGGELFLRLQGGWQEKDCQLLRSALQECAATAPLLTVDISRVTDVCGSFVALMLLACGWFTARGGFRIVGANAVVTLALRRKMAEHLLVPS